MEALFVILGDADSLIVKIGNLELGFGDAFLSQYFVELGSCSRLFRSAETEFIEFGESHAGRHVLESDSLFIVLARLVKFLHLVENQRRIE